MYTQHNMSFQIKKLKTDTERGKLNKKLFECLYRPPENEKKLQTNLNPPNCNCQCRCSLKRRRSKMSPESSHNTGKPDQNKNTSQIQNSQNVTQPSKKELDITSEEMPQNNSLTSINQTEILHFSPKSSKCMTMESQESDELMTQLEKLFEGDQNDDDLFESTLCDTLDSAGNDDIAKRIQKENVYSSEKLAAIQNKNSLIENHTAEIKSLDEKLVTLATLFLNTAENNNIFQNKAEPQKGKPLNSKKWLCEEHFLKSHYFQLLDLISETNRKKLARVNVHTEYSIINVLVSKF